MDGIVFSVMCLFSHAVATEDRQTDHEVCMKDHEELIKHLADNLDRVEEEVATQVQTIDTVLADVGGSIDVLERKLKAQGEEMNELQAEADFLFALLRCLIVLVVCLVLERLCVYFL